MEMCRACLSTGINMIPMDESILEDFNHITNLNIKLSDHMLLYTCEECHNALIFCKQFREKCIASDHALNKILFPNDKMKVELNDEENDYYLIVNKEGQDDIDIDDITDDYYDSEIKNDVTTIQTIIETKEEEEESQNPVLNSDTLCGLCSASFYNKDTLIEHLSIHIDDSNCQICRETSTSKSQLLAHRMQHIPDKQKGCLFCDKAFVGTASLEFHYMTIHKLDKKVFDEVKQDYFDRKITFVIEEPPLTENKVLSKDNNSARIKKRRLKEKNNVLKVIKNKVVVDTNKIVLSESELKKLLEKPKEGFVPYYCGICPQELEEKRQLTRHLQYHKMDTHCSLCELEFKGYPHMLAHRLAHIPNSQNSCLFCPRKILYESELEQHYMDMHNSTKKVLLYFCTYCLRKYETENQMLLHMNNHGPIKYICDYCSKGFRHKGALVSHIVSHQDRRQYKCSQCDYRAKFAGAIKEHMLRRHNKSRVYCTICRRAFPSIDMLDRHKPCIMDADVMCPTCGINLKMSSSLKRHLRTHTDTYTYKCQLCPSKYKSKSSYDTHMDKHNGIRKFECEYCSKKFYSQPVLIKHRRIHTGERPYACKLCDKAFTGNNNLKVHMRVHGIELIKKELKNTR